ncbi:MAG TPA: hypothetical protein VMC03_09385 [Streptosporangiaceae bacterium]|nr:hypothetical protein [Streptosporangiaceae bacterium]
MAKYLAGEIGRCGARRPVGGIATANVFSERRPVIGGSIGQKGTAENPIESGFRQMRHLGRRQNYPKNEDTG